MRAEAPADRCTEFRSECMTNESAWRRRKRRWNWARTASCCPREVRFPESEEEIVRLVRHCYENAIPLKVVGAGHSYNDLASCDTDGYLVSLKKFNKLEHVDTEAKVVTFQGGLRTASLNRKIFRRGLALQNLGTNVFDSFAGACSTGYHGSGTDYRIQSDRIEWLEIVNGRGEKVRVERSDPDFPAVGVGLGAFGIVIRMAVRCGAAFNMEVAEWPCAREELDRSLERIKAVNEHCKVLWIPHTETYVLWTGNRTRCTEDPVWVKWKRFVFHGVFINNLVHGLLLSFAVRRRSRVPRINRVMARILHGAGNMTVLGCKWVFMLPHVVRQDAIEYAVPEEHALACLGELDRRIREKGYWVDTCVEVRFVRDDGFWLSPAYRRRSCYIGTKIHFPM